MLTSFYLFIGKNILHDSYTEGTTSEIGHIPEGHILREDMGHSPEEAITEGLLHLYNQVDFLPKQFSLDDICHSEMTL